MSGCFTHILLAKHVYERVEDPGLKEVLYKGFPFLAAGSAAPDLPYGSYADDDLFLKTDYRLADRFHHESTNAIPLLAMKKLKSRLAHGSYDFCGQVFSFYAGYILHFICDSVIHPFIRDKTGDYGRNQAYHRKIEFALDVIYYHYHYGQTADLRSADIHNNLKQVLSSKGKKSVLHSFSKAISIVYNEFHEPDEIEQWISGLYRMLQFAETRYPGFIRFILDTYLLPEMSDIKNDLAKICILRNTVERKRNFLGTNKINYLTDCIPRFFTIAMPVIKKAYDYVYSDGPALTAFDLPGINLDTGRLLNDGEEGVPYFWRGF